MNSKTSKKIRQYATRNAKDVFEAYRDHINSYPFKTRLKIALRILVRKF